MKIRIVALLLASATLLFANSQLFMGMRNQRFLFSGIQYRAYGVAYEQSLFNQDPDQQHGSLGLFAEYTLPLSVTLWYAVYGGMQYDADYYDYGGEVGMVWDAFDYFGLKARYRPFYDSDLGTHYGYLVQLQTFPFKEVGFYAGLKNMPDYRDVERRVFGGMLFDVGRLEVYPEISTPVHGSFEWTRVQLNFIYHCDFH